MFFLLQLLKDRIKHQTWKIDSSLMYHVNLDTTIWKDLVTRVSKGTNWWTCFSLLIKLTNIKYKVISYKYYLNIHLDKADAYDRVELIRMHTLCKANCINYSWCDFILLTGTCKDWIFHSSQLIFVKLLQQICYAGYYI